MSKKEICSVEDVWDEESRQRRAHLSIRFRRMCDAKREERERARRERAKRWPKWR